MTNVLIQEVPEDVIEALQRRAAEHRRPLHDELLFVLQQAADEAFQPIAAQVLKTIRERLAGEGITFGSSAPLIAEDRER